MIEKTKLYQFVDKASKLDVGAMFVQAFGNSVIKRLIIELNTQEQLFNDGVDSNNEPLFSNIHNRGFYSKRTEAMTNGKKKAGDHYTLYDTGEFYRSFKVDVSPNGIRITADGQKEDTNLFFEYGEEIVGLTPEHKAIVANEAKQYIKKWIKSELVI